MKSLKWAFSLILICVTGFTKGGDVVGNGAGLSENNVIYAYKLLPHLLDACIAKESCYQNSADLLAYNKIKHTLVVSLRNELSEMLQFVSATGSPGFFVTAANEPDRIAKTCINGACPVYFNIDLLNRSNLAYPSLASLLTHEFGHQAGYADHAYLDGLGAKIRMLAESKFTSYVYPYDFNKIEFRQINSDFPLKFSEFHFVWNNETTRLTDEIYKEVAVVPGFVGFEMFNGHYIFESSPAAYAQFEIWAKVYAATESSGPVQLRLMKFKLEISPTGKIQKFNRN